MLLVQAVGGVHPAWGQTPADTGTTDPAGTVLVIEAVRSYDMDLDPAGTVRVPPDRRALEIHYRVRGGDPAAGYTYALRLEGADRRWEDARERTVVRYRHLRPGEYTFHVRANGPGGELGPVSLPVVVERRWFETWWR
jgi:hypothetical protein